MRKKDENTYDTNNENDINKSEVAMRIKAATRLICWGVW